MTQIEIPAHLADALITRIDSIRTAELPKISARRVPMFADGYNSALKDVVAILRESRGPKVAIHSVTWSDGRKPTFTCDGDRSSKCHSFPDCDCETWSEDHNERHPFVTHEAECWVINWLNAFGGDTYQPSDDDLPGDIVPPHIDGPIEWDWDESVNWRYAAGVLSS